MRLFPYLKAPNCSVYTSISKCTPVHSEKNRGYECIFLSNQGASRLYSTLASKFPFFCNKKQVTMTKPDPVISERNTGGCDRVHVFCVRFEEDRKKKGHTSASRE